MKTNVLFFVILINFAWSCASQKTTCRVDGKIIHADIEAIELLKPNQLADKDSVISLPVKKGRFSYEVLLTHPEYVKLHIKVPNHFGAKEVPLFLENTSIDILLNGKQSFNSNKIQGGRLNKEYNQYNKFIQREYSKQWQLIQDSVNILKKSNQYFSDTLNTLLKEINQAETDEIKIALYKILDEIMIKGLDLTPAAQQLWLKTRAISSSISAYKQRYIQKSPTLVAYSFFLDELTLNQQNIDVKQAKDNYLLLSAAHPGHPYNTLALKLISGADGIQPGDQIIDFTAPDLNGHQHQLSKLLANQDALLILWATWCGPCIAKSKTMLPIYQLFGGKEFTIIGIAAEYKNTDQLIKFLEKEKWPWVNLVELDRQNDIWMNYGVNNKSGAIYLIDKSGKVIALDPTPEEVLAYLRQRQ